MTRRELILWVLLISVFTMGAFWGNSITMYKSGRISFTPGANRMSIPQCPAGYAGMENGTICFDYTAVKPVFVIKDANGPRSL
jgi:hypothetical protein